MKNWLVTLAIALGACALSFAAFYTINREPGALRTAAQSGNALEWMRVEFRLNDAQYQTIRQMHEQYGAVCSQHCDAIMNAEKRGAPPAEIAALENTCVESMTEHFKRVAAVMSAAQGQRYLAIVLPRVHDYDHRGAPDVQARR